MYYYQKRLLNEAKKVTKEYTVEEVLLIEGLFDKIKSVLKKEPLAGKIMALRAMKGKVSGSEYSKKMQEVIDTALIYLMKASGPAAIAIPLAHRTGLAKLVDKVVHHLAQEPHAIHDFDHIIHSALGMLGIVAHYAPEGELTEATAQDRAKAYDAKIWDAMTRVKMIKDKAKQLGVRVQTDGKTATCIKEFPKGDANAFRAAYDACYSVICLFRFTKNTNLWGCSTAGFGVGAQECIKNGRIVLNKSGDGAQLQFRGLDRGLYLSNGTKAF